MAFAASEEASGSQQGKATHAPPAATARVTQRTHNPAARFDRPIEVTHNPAAKVVSPRQIDHGARGKAASPATSNPQKEPEHPTNSIQHNHTERQAFLDILSTIVTFLNNAISTIEQHVDPHDERALTAFFSRMAKENVVKCNLPKYAAGTGLAKTLNALDFTAFPA